jgi:hypothetical protein
MSKTLTLLLMDPPFESANTTTAFRLIDAALHKGHTVNVFAYEGAVNLTMKGQEPHPNPAHGKSVEEEHHPLTRDIVAGLFDACAGSTVGSASMNGELVTGSTAPSGVALRTFGRG